MTTSAKGSSLVYRWPPYPVSSPRLSKARPTKNAFRLSHLDDPWRASHLADEEAIPEHISESDSEYHWQRLDAALDSMISLSSSPSHPSPGMNSPNKDGGHGTENPEALDYDHLFGYSAELLASLLCPHPSMCHQKFELLADDLAFIGHPVCAEEDGGWRFKPEKVKSNSRGRETGSAPSPLLDEYALASPDRPSPSEKAENKGWLHTFHFVIVLDIPDPSSSASGNVSKYFDIIYEQVAFTVTAVLFQEQVLSNFVESECDVLGSLKESCISKGESFSSFEHQALEVSSIAPAMKALYDAIKSSSMAYLTIHNLPLEVQLPPYLDVLLHSEGETDLDFINPDDEHVQAWGQEMRFGWRLPALAPWKSLLLLDEHHGFDPTGTHVNPEDKTLVEGLIRFLETASVTLSLADMASLLDWDLESQVMPTVRWLVQHRRAKVVDIVHAGLKTVFTLPPTFDRPLAHLTVEFDNQFSHLSIPSLPQILSTISASVAKQSGNHFFASVVQDKELISMYHDVVLWMLKRDMLITLHLRIRVVATSELKVRVRIAREKALASKAGGMKDRDQHGFQSESTHPVGLDEASSAVMWLSPHRARQYSIRPSSKDSEKSKLSELVVKERDGDDDSNRRSTDEDPETDEDGLGWDTEDFTPSMINDPGRAKPLQRRWLSAMSEGKEPPIARRFELINQYFDGKKTDDEILYRAEITRKQLREVLHHYEEYLQTFLHPS